jgi:Ala-tRNA(Pro) deacylase
MSEEGTVSTAHGPYEDLLVWLADHDVPFVLHEHPTSYTATATAHAEGVSERSFAKVVGVRSAEGASMLIVVDAPDHVDFEQTARFLGTEWVTLLSEHEMEALLPECEAGTIPPIPELARVPVYADEGLRGEDSVSFHAGSHRTAVRVARAAWEQAAGVRYGSFVSVASAA